MSIPLMFLELVLSAIICISSILLVVMAAIVLTLVFKYDHKSNQTSITQTVCRQTDYKQRCSQTLSAAGGKTKDPKELIKVALTSTEQQISLAIQNLMLLKDDVKDPRVYNALDICHELLNHSISDIQKTFEKVSTNDAIKMKDYMNDLKTWLSGAITYQQTCLDGFENTMGNTGYEMKSLLRPSEELTSNDLALITEFSKTTYSSATSGRRKLLPNELPTWITSQQRRLLAATPVTVNPNVVVAKDGSGKYMSICEALKDVPSKNNNTFVIYIKAGVYNEYIIIPKSMMGVYLIGDGPTVTKITGNRSYVGHYNTYHTPTVAANGDRFMAKDIGFKNTAGPENHQAVALRVSSDYSVIYNCQFDGYQDTLYAHVHRQFYRDCTITGTVDFIFGDAAAVFQNCHIVIRKPLKKQKCTVTAQGRKDIREITGFVLQNCTITASPELGAVQAEFRSYLGRPWRTYSRTVIMQSQIDWVIDPAGWLPWKNTSYVETCWYAEYNNTGPGSKIANRVNWPGIQKSITPEMANGFTAAQFIDGDSWMPATGIPYTPGMV